MNRPTTALALAAAALALLTGCGGEKVADDGTDACKNAVYKRYDDALAALASSTAGKSADEAAEQFGKAVGNAPPPECDKVPAEIADGIAGQVALEYTDKIDAAIALIEKDAGATAAPSGAPSTSPSEAPSSEASAEPSASPSAG
jgi:hypothetical protein